MYFLTDEKRKISFGWSAKSGCSHVKNLFSFLTKNERRPNDEKLHQDFDYQGPPNPQTYGFFIFIRNPYERIVSGFLEKYKASGEFHHLWSKTKTLTFENFVDALYEQDFTTIDHHHFSPQLSETWDDKILLSSQTVFYDIGNIDYSNFERIFQKEIPQDVRNFRGRHANNNPRLDCGKIYTLGIASFDFVKPYTKNFYNEPIKSKVFHTYQKDFKCFKSLGFEYDMNL